MSRRRFVASAAAALLLTGTLAVAQTGEVTVTLPRSTAEELHVALGKALGTSTTTTAAPTTTTSEQVTTTTAAQTTTTATTLPPTTTTTVAATTTTTTTAPPQAGSYGAGISGASLPVPSGAISVTPSTLAAEINSRPAGTAFALQPGTYEMGAIPNKTGNRYYGVPSNHGAVVFDGQLNHDVAWAVADNNLFANMTFRRYRGLDDAPGNAPLLAVGGPDNLIIRNVEFRDNLKSGLRFGGVAWHVSYITSQRNGQYCINGSGTNHVVELSLFAQCGVDGLDVPRHSDSNRGVSKFNHSTGIVVRNSEFANFTGGANGLWFDGNNSGFVIEGNYLHDMGRHGIITELGEGGTIRNNRLVDVASGTQTQAYRDAAIFNHWGGATLIEENTIDGARNGIILYQHDRTFNPDHADPICGSVIRNNTISNVDNSWTGAQSTFTYEGCNPSINPGQVVWSNNTESGNVRHWLNGDVSPAQWAARGYS